MERTHEPEGTQLLFTAVQGNRVLGYLAIDSLVAGTSCGGLRLLPDIDEAEMRGLARAMTLKYGFLGLPQGGAKAGVRGDPEASAAERRRMLAAFARAIAPLLRNRIYVPGSDMGTDNADVRHVMQAAGARVKARELRGTQSGYYTALTVLAGARQAARHVNLELAGSRVAVEGFGKVGAPLAELLAAAGARVVAVSTSCGAIYRRQGLDVRRLNALAAEVGSRLVDRYPGGERLEREALLELPADLLCPCARHNSLHMGNAARVKARIVCPGANNPVTPEAELALFDRGILCLPDFVTNSGGVLGGTMEFASIGRKEIAAFMDREIGGRIARLLAEAHRKRVLPREIAVPMALRRHEQVRRNAGRPNLANRLFGIGLELYRQGLVPGALVRPLALPYFARALA